MNTETQKPKSTTSLYVIGAIKDPKSKNVTDINNLTILGHDDKQLTYEYVVADLKPDKNRFWRMSVRECVGGITIDTKEKFYHFVQDYLNDQKQIEAGELPTKLINDFYAFINKTDAEKVLQKLNEKQDKQFDSLYPFMQPYVSKQKLVIIDLIEELAKYVPIALKEMMDNPETRATFEKNMEKFTHKKAEE